MTRLSVNINKIATLRNARGGNLPDVEKAARDCERFGAEGITVHPRPDERHIRYSDVRLIRPGITTEFNIEGNPIGSFIDLVCEVVPDQVTLVPDAHDAITSNAGWDTVANREFLTGICALFKSKGIRTSIFIDPDPAMAEGVVSVRLFPCELKADQGDHARSGVGEVVEGVRSDRDRADKYSCGKFSRKKNQIKKNTDCSREDAIAAPHLGKVGFFMIRNK